MVEVSETTIDQLESIAEDEEELEELKEEFKENHQEFQEKTEGLSDEQVETLALRKTRTEHLKESRIPSDYIEIATVGGEIRNTSNGDMFFGTGVVDREPNEESSRQELASIRIFDGELASEIYNAFDEVGNVVSGNFSVEDGDIDFHAEVSDADDTEFEVTRPEDRVGVVNDIRNKVDEISIANIADNMTGTTRNDDGDVYPISSDIRRMVVDIFDGYKNAEEGFGIYTVRDDTVFDEEDIKESVVYNAEEADDNATPGLSCWIDPNDMEYGSGSTVEVFGTITKNNDGEIVMNVDGVIPVPVGMDDLVTDFDGYEVTEDSDAPSRDDIETENVDRTTI